MKRKSILWTIAIMCLFSIIGCEKPTETKIVTVSIINQTGSSIALAHIRVSGTTSWGNNRLSSNIAEGASTTFEIADTGTYDVRITNIEGITFTKLSVQLNLEDNPLTFTTNDYDTISITITNNTRQAINSICIRANGTIEWGDNLLSEALADSSVSQPFILPYPHTPGGYDVQLATSSGFAFTKKNVQINIGVNNLSFTSNEMSNISLIITNNTGLTTNSIYIRANGVTDWGTNLSSVALVDSSVSQPINIPYQHAPGQYDIQIGYRDNVTFTKTNIQLNAGNNFLTINGNDFTLIGSSIEFGDYNWIVLGYQDLKMLVISQDIIDTLAFHSTNIGITWSNSSLRAYLNGTFYDSFSVSDKTRIVEVTNINVIKDYTYPYGTDGGPDTTDKIFLLSFLEAGTYSIANRIALYNGIPSWWWLRTPGRYQNYASIVSYAGTLNAYGSEVVAAGGVRPSLWLKCDESLSNKLSYR